MKTFIVSDIHGRVEELYRLLNQAGLLTSFDIEGEDEPVLTALGNKTQIVSVGDLLNAVQEDIGYDEATAALAREWFDFVLVGNHESPYLWNDHYFGGYYPHPPLRSLYNSWLREGFVKPALAIGNTLVTHAGIAKAHPVFKGISTAEEALGVIEVAWQNKLHGAPNGVFDAVGYARGGRWPYGGILWSDFNSEPRKKKFSQVHGHTPIAKGPVLVENEKHGTFLINIDSACKGGGAPTGLWLDEEGQIESWVKLEAETRQ